MKKYILYLSFVSLLVSCGKSTPDTSANTDTEDAAVPAMVSLTPEQFQHSGIQTGCTQMRPISQTLKANGLLDVPPQNLVSISPPMGGFLKVTTLLQGMRVKKGEVIAVIENMDFIPIQQDYLDSKSQLEYLQAEYKRQQELSTENVNATKTLQQAKAQYLSMAAKANGLKARLKMLHIDPASVEKGNIRSTINLYAPINGFVTQVHANVGAYVNPTDVLFKLIDPEHIHVELTIFEKDIPKLKIGQKVLFMLANETTQRTASVFLIHKEIAADRSVGVHCHLDVEDTSLLPGTYLKAWIETGNSPVTTLPEEAVINNGEMKYIFVQKSRTATAIEFERLPIETGAQENGYIQVRSLPGSVSSGIVVKGAYHLWAKMNNVEEEE